MELVRTAIPDVFLLKPRVFSDARGFFLESYNQRMLADLGLVYPFVQDNHSRSHKNVLRGLHYQLPQPQGKLVRVIAGEVFDVMVDLRSDSPTFGKWAAAVLSSENKHLLWAPPGFAHGFLVLSDWAEFVYKTTDYYAPQFEHTIRWDDPDLAIDWPFQQKPILSQKDENGVPLREAKVYLTALISESQ